MKLPLLKTFCIGGLLYSLSVGSVTQAETLPWLSEAINDPFATQKKATGLIASQLQPDNCASLPDVAHKLRLSEVVIISLCNNPATKAAYHSLLGQAATYGSSYSAYLPTIIATLNPTHTVTYSPNSLISTDTNPTGLQANWVLYDFGQREFTIEAAEQSLIAAGQTYNSTLQGAIASALQGYYRLLTSQNAVKVTLASEHFAKESYTASHLRHQIGQVPLADELQAKGAYAQTQLATEQAINQLSLDQAALGLLMGLPADTPLEVAEINNNTLLKDPFGGKVHELMEEAQRKRADVLASRAQLESAKASFAALKRSDLATVAASVNANTDHLYIANRNLTRTQSIGISVSIPIFTGFHQTYSERAAREQLGAQEQQLTLTKLTVQQDVWNAWHNYKTSQETWKTSFDLLTSANQLKDVALGRYREGLGTILDVLSAQSQYSSALQSQLQSRYNLLATRVDLVRAVGVLNLDTMHPELAMDTSPPTDNSGIAR